MHGEDEREGREDGLGRGEGRAGGRVRAGSWRRWAAGDGVGGWEGGGSEPKRNDGLRIFGRVRVVGGE